VVHIDKLTASAHNLGQKVNLNATFFARSTSMWKSHNSMATDTIRIMLVFVNNVRKEVNLKNIVNASMKSSNVITQQNKNRVIRQRKSSYTV
jgi:hypothetical protein